MSAPMQKPDGLHLHWHTALFSTVSDTHTFTPRLERCGLTSEGSAPMLYHFLPITQAYMVAINTPTPSDTLTRAPDTPYETVETHASPAPPLTASHGMPTD
eukprot:7391519-Prymnesium_polylepis.2